MYVDKADSYMADILYEKGAYGEAKCYYQVCLDKEEKKPKRKQSQQRIDYFKRRIKQCEEGISEGN